MAKLRNTLSDAVRAHLRDGILSGDYAPGQRIRETEIAEIVGVSRSPIREAIKILEAEGLLVSEAWQGLTIANPSRLQTLEIFQYREALEGLSAELACTSITSSELDDLEALVDKVDGKKRATPAELVRNNQEFHQTIYDATHNQYLIESVGTVKTLLALLPAANYTKDNRREVIVSEHRRIVKALRRRDPKAARSAACSHVRNSAKVQLQQFVTSVVE